MSIFFQKLAQYLQSEFGEVLGTTSVSGGCINQCYKVDFKNESVFIKLNHSYKDMFQKEAQALDDLAEALTDNQLCVPKVLKYHEEFLILEYIPPGSMSDDYLLVLAGGLFELSKHTKTVFGYHQDNYIGTTRQINTHEREWGDFFVKHRLEYQINLLEESLFKQQMLEFFSLYKDLLKNKLNSLSISATPVHGDLWSGNIYAGESAPYLIDPAYYYGDPNTDFAMTTLFGAQPASFYFELKNLFKDDYRPELFDIYNLYHVLNHVNLFGASYQSQAIDLCQKIPKVL